MSPICGATLWSRKWWGSNGCPASRSSPVFFRAFPAREPTWIVFAACSAGAWSVCPAAREGYALDLDSTRLLHEEWTSGGGGGGLYAPGNQAVFASAPGRLERSAPGGQFLAASGRQQL